VDCLSKGVLIGVSMLLVLTIGSPLLRVNQPVTNANRRGCGQSVGVKMMHFESVGRG
jgi:hypothetical protein